MKATVKFVHVKKSVQAVPMSDTEAQLRADLLRKSAKLKSLEETCKHLTDEIAERDTTIKRLVIDAENSDETIRKLNTKITHQVGQIYAYKSILEANSRK